MYIYIYTYTFIYVHIYTHIYIYIYIRTYTYIYIHIHIFMRILCRGEAVMYWNLCSKVKRHARNGATTEHRSGKVQVE